MITEVVVKIINKTNNKTPYYDHFNDAGFDLRSNENVTVNPQERVIVDTGMVFEIPEGTQLEIRSRSGLAAKHGIFVLNSPGTVDCGYSDTIKIILYNTAKNPFEINIGDRIAQAVLMPYYKAIFSVVEEVGESERGKDGFGSSGLK